MLSDLKWDSLQTQREKARLVIFYRVTHGLVDIPLPKDLLQMPCKSTRNFHPKKYRSLACKTNYLNMGTFSPSTVYIWNTLPAATLDQPKIAKFKDKLDLFYRLYILAPLQVFNSHIRYAMLCNFFCICMELLFYIRAMVTAFAD